MIEVAGLFHENVEIFHLYPKETVYTEKSYVVGKAPSITINNDTKINVMLKFLKTHNPGLISRNIEH